MSFLAFSFTLLAQEHFVGPIESCKDVYDGIQDDCTEYFDFGANSNNNNNDIQRYYKVLFTHPGCDTTSYKEVFREDFNGNALDTTRWRTKDVCPPPFDTIGCGCTKDDAEIKEKRDKMWLPSNVTVDGGYLHLKTGEINPTLYYTCVNGNGQTMTLDKRFSSAQVVSKNIIPNAFGGGCFKYGRITIRAKVPNNNNGKNTIGAIWFFGWAG